MPAVPLSVSHPALIEEWADDTRSPDILTAGSKFTVQWKCRTCLHVWHARIQNRVHGKGCPACTGKVATRATSVASLRPDLLAEWADTRSAETFTVGSSKPVLWKCAACEHEWKTSVHKRTQGAGCPACAGKVVSPGKSLADLFPALAAEMQGDPSSLLPGSSVKVAWRCSVCAHRWEAIVSNRALKGRGCPACSGRVAVAGVTDLGTTHPSLVEEIADGTDSSSIKAGSHNRVKWQCAKCGGSWVTEVYNRALYKGGCPTCYKKTFVSRFEREVADFVSGMVAIETTVRRFPGVTEVDIYVPSRNMAIECNGVYWHSEGAGKTSVAHRDKLRACDAVGIELVQVWEDDWRLRRPVVEAMLRHKLGLSDQRTVHARKTVPSFIDRIEAKAFFEAHHIQGPVGASYYLGLRDGDGLLVAAMGLKKSKSGELRLERYATAARVPGGHSKLVAFAERELEWDSLVTFADREVSDGALYEATGWVREAELKPDYKYVKQGRRHHKFGYRLVRFRNDPTLKFEEGLSERELAILNGLHRAWDSGKVRYRYSRRTAHS